MAMKTPAATPGGLQSQVWVPVQSSSVSTNGGWFSWTSLSWGSPTLSWGSVSDSEKGLRRPECSKSRA